MKIQNFLLDETGNAIMADMSMARMIGNRMTTELGTIQWAALEVMEPALVGYDCSVDTYSFGIILWEVLTCSVPYGPRRPTATAAIIQRSQMTRQPARRLRTEAVRKALESDSCNLEGTQPEHLRVLESAQEAAAREKHRVLDLVHDLTPLDHELVQLNFPFSERLLTDLFRLSNQHLALDVQEAAFELLNRLAVRAMDA
jgi:serine/threonine protein kinase